MVPPSPMAPIVQSEEPPSDVSGCSDGAGGGESGRCPSEGVGGGAVGRSLWAVGGPWDDDSCGGLGGVGKLGGGDDGDGDE